MVEILVSPPHEKLGAISASRDCREIYVASVQKHTARVIEAILTRDRVLLRAVSLSRGTQVPVFQRVFRRAGQLTRAAGLTPAVADVAGRLIRILLGSLRSSQSTVQAAALVVAWAACVGEKCTVTQVARFAGVSQGAVSRRLWEIFPAQKSAGPGKEHLREMRERIAAAFRAKGESPR